MKRYFYLMSLLALLATVICSVLGMFSKAHLIFDLASHFRPHYAIAACIALIIFFFYRSYWLALLSVIVLIFNLTFIVPWYFGNQEAASKEREDIKLFVSNVLGSNRDYRSIISLIEKENPDIIVVMEINGGWVNALSVIKKKYMHSKLVPREDSFGIGVYSKLPILMESVEYFGLSGAPSIVLSLGSAQGNVTLLATHPMSPVGADRLKSRNKQLLDIAQEAQKIEGPLIVAGDLNTTMWSSHYRQLEKNGNLRNARRGFGINATWPSPLGILGIPIDHVLVSDDILVVDLKVGESIGSDHLPLIVELSISGTASQGT